MPTFRSLPVLLLFWLCLHGTTTARPPRSEVEVVMFAVPEAHWQTKFEGQFKEHPALWKQLDDEANRERIERPLEMKCLLIGGEPVVQRRGEDKEFVEGWVPQFDSIMPTEKTHRFIGTTVELTRRDSMKPDQPMRVMINLEHHLSPPIMQRINYANAAVGAERDKLSVEYPQFEKIEWKGEAVVWPEWRLVANILRPQREGAGAVPAMRYILFIKRPDR